MSLCSILLQMSTGHHPQTDGSSEVMNRTLENYLRYYCNIDQDNSDEILAAAEFS